MSKPRPEDHRTAAEYRWARKLWRRWTGGSLIGTFLLCALVGGLSGSVTATLALLIFGLGLHLYVRRTRG